MPLIKQILEKYAKRNKLMEPWTFIFNPAIWLLLLLGFLGFIFGIFLITGFFFIIWLVLTGRWFKILSEIKRKTDKDYMQDDL
jgi:hypothetical protein